MTNIDHVDSKRKNISIEAIVSMRDKNMSIKEIAEYCNCSKQNIHKRLQHYDDFKKFQIDKATAYEYKQYLLHNSINEHVIQKMPGIHRITGVGILEDKIRLIRGQSTQNSAINIQMSIEHKAVAEEVLRQIKAKEIEKVINTSDNTSSDLQT